MKIYLLSALALLCLTLDVLAQGDVPETAQHEIARRGNHVELTGTIRSGLMAAALAPPADDSAKWFLTLIVKPGQPASEAMKTLLATDPALRPWIDTREPSKSTMHYQIRSVDDRTQADWLAGLKGAIDKYGLPLIVVQPPKTGQFGSTETIVKLLGGHRTGPQLAQALRDGIVEYVTAVERRVADAHSVRDAGHAQQVVGVPPPFQVPPKDQPVDPKPNALPFEWPPVVPPAAPPIVPPAAPPVVPPNPSLPAPALPTSWLAMTALGMFVAGWVSARLKTSLSAKAADITRAYRMLTQQTSAGPKDPPST